MQYFMLFKNFNRLKVHQWPILSVTNLKYVYKIHILQHKALKKEIKALNQNTNNDSIIIASLNCRIKIVNR